MLQGGKDDIGVRDDIELRPSPGWVPAAVTAVKRMSAQAMVAHAMHRNPGRNLQGDLHFHLSRSEQKCIRFGLA